MPSIANMVAVRGLGTEGRESPSGGNSRERGRWVSLAGFFDYAQLVNQFFTHSPDAWF